MTSICNRKGHEIGLLRIHTEKVNNNNKKDDDNNNDDNISNCNPESVRNKNVTVACGISFT